MVVESTNISAGAILRAYKRLKDIAFPTPLQFSTILSERYDCEVYLKREDLQVVRSYKIRGAYNKISSLSPEELAKGVVCASAGNHAQGFALSCALLKVNGTVYMPATTTKQKTDQVKMFGREYVQIKLIGDTFDDAYHEAIKDSKQNSKAFIHPFDDIKTIEGQGTVGHEIYQDSPEKPFDYLFIPVGGGGLSAGVGSYFKEVSPTTKLIGLEPEGAPAMKTSIENGVNTELETIDKFVDGAAVKKVGDITFEICKEVLDEVCLIPEGKICSTILQLYNEAAIVVEPAGALSIAALDFYKEKIKGKTICCIVSGGNNDITRMAEITERSLLYEKLRHYFIVRFPQRAGALREFLTDILGPNDDIFFFEYKKKTSRNAGPAVIGIELKTPDDYAPLIERMKTHNIRYEYLNDKDDLFEYLV